MLTNYPDLPLILTRWAVGGVRSLVDSRSVLPRELAERVTDVAHRPVRSNILCEREISGTLRRARQTFWMAVVPERLAGGYLELAQPSGVPLVLCRNGFNAEAAAWLCAELNKMLNIEDWTSGSCRSVTFQEENPCFC